jgi:hypothetical protein
MRRLFVPDLQIPFQDTVKVQALKNFIRSSKPDQVLQTGDLVDFESLGRWVRGRHGEFTADIKGQIDQAKRVIEDLRIEHWSRGNHEERLDKYVEERAPALLGFPGLTIEEAFDLENLGCTYHREMYEFFPGWILAHGDEGPLSGIAGQTALKLAKKIGKSVVCGHGHRAAIATETESFNFLPTRTLYGIEAGHAMDLKQAKYLRGTYANWQSAFVVIDTDGDLIHPQVVYMNGNGDFIFQGKSYRNGKLVRGTTK